MSQATFWKIATLSLACLLGTPALAPAQERGYQPPPQVPTIEYQKKVLKPGSTENAVRQELAVTLNAALELAKKGDLQGALAKVKEADGMASDKSPYEEYAVAKLLGQYSAQLHDNKTAATAFNRALASGAVPEDEKPQVLRIDLGVNINAGNYAQAVTAGEELRTLGKADPDALSDLSLAYYQKGDFKSALKTAQASLAMQGATPSQSYEQTLKILLNSQIRTNDRLGANQTRDRLCALKPPPADIKCGPAG
jgi:tetratricopeptide (TPR) repeat protein